MSGIKNELIDLLEWIVETKEAVGTIFITYMMGTTLVSIVVASAISINAAISIFFGILSIGIIFIVSLLTILYVWLWFIETVLPKLISKLKGVPNNE